MEKKNKIIIISLVVVILVLFSLLVLMYIGVISLKENKENSEIVKQKSTVSNSQIITYYKNMLEDYNKEEHSYSVKDINNDGIPELFIYTGGVIGNAIIADTYVYTYDENMGTKDANYVIYVGSLNGRINHNTVFYKMNDGSLLTVTGNQGYETVSSYRLVSDWLVRDNTSSKEVTEYTTGDEEITFKPCSDLSLLDQYN